MPCPCLGTPAIGPVFAQRRVIGGRRQNAGVPSRVSFQSIDPNDAGSMEPADRTHSMIVLRISSEFDHTCWAAATCGKLPPPLAR